MTIANPSPKRLAALDSYIAGGRHVRAVRHTAASGCLLTTLSPEVDEAERVSACPAEVMPAWLAYFTAWFEYAGLKAARPEMVRRYAGLAHRWHILDAGAWHRLDLMTRKIALNEARRHVPAMCPAVMAIDRTRALLDRKIAGDSSAANEWEHAWACASYTTWAAAEKVAEAAVWKEAWAVSTAARAASTAASARVVMATGAAGAAEASAATRVAAKVAAAEAADRITRAVLDAIEAEIIRAETASP